MLNRYKYTLYTIYIYYAKPYSAKEQLGKNTLPEVRSFMFKIYKNYYSDRGESNEESTMNAVRKVRFWLKKIVCAINKQNSTGIL